MCWPCLVLPAFYLLECRDSDFEFGFRLQSCMCLLLACVSCLHVSAACMCLLLACVCALQHSVAFLLRSIPLRPAPLGPRFSMLYAASLRALFPSHTHVCMCMCVYLCECVCMCVCVCVGTGGLRSTGVECTPHIWAQVLCFLVVLLSLSFACPCVHTHVHVPLYTHTCTCARAYTYMYENIHLYALILIECVLLILTEHVVIQQYPN